MRSRLKTEDSQTQVTGSEESEIEQSSLHPEPEASLAFGSVAVLYNLAGRELEREGLDQ
jgi:hypothetical protein